MLCYVHVPFCISKCAYCSFYSEIFCPEKALQYLELVQLEIAQWSQILGKRQLRTVYFGGGTPSLLQPEQIAQILETVAKYFDLDTKAEITLEANPESIVRPGLLANLLDMGVNRLSLGVQSMADKTLQILGRPHNAEQSRLAIQRAREIGFTNISLDCIWGIPGQSAAKWTWDLQKILALEPDHLSAYALTLENGSPLTQQVDNGQWAMPKDEALAKMYTQTVELCQASGLMHYEISNFAHPGKESLHNFGYWTGEDYLGLGPSAVSTINNQRWTNPLGLNDYGQVVLNGSAREKEILSPKTRLQEKIMLALRTKKGLGLQKILPQIYTSPSHEMSLLLKDLQSQNLIQVQCDRLYLTSSGMLVSNSIIELVLDAMDRQHADTRIP